MYNNKITIHTLREIFTPIVSFVCAPACLVSVCVWCSGFVLVRFVVMSLDRICSYSTIIFAMNVWVLLVVAIVTDYWEYRGFKFAEIRKHVLPSNTTERYHPVATTSYFVIEYFWEAAARTGIKDVHPNTSSGYVEQLFDQPPSLVSKVFVKQNATLVESVGNAKVETMVEQRRDFREGTFLYFQHGNLFRDCDDLEAGVRIRLGLAGRRPHRCFNFIVNPRPPSDYVIHELSAVVHLERSAFLFGVASVLAATLSLAGGCFGCLMHDRSGLILASGGAVVSAVLLIICIAVFHTKCHLIHRHEFMQGIQLPYKRLIDASRTQRYGWSFMLAWLCVAMLLLQAYVWLNKAQDYGIMYSSNSFEGTSAVHTDGGMSSRVEQFDLLLDAAAPRKTACNGAHAYVGSIISCDYL